MHAYVLRDSIWIAVSVLPIACNVATTVLVHRPCPGPMNLPKPSSATAHSNAKSLRTYVPDQPLAATATLGGNMRYRWADCCNLAIFVLRAKSDH